MTQGLQINCDFCRESVTVPGGLLFTPIPDSPQLRKKEHFCAQCSARVSDILDLAQNGDGAGGLYIGPPFDTISWTVPYRFLNAEEEQKIRELFT